MLIIKNLRLGMRRYNDEIKFCIHLLKAVGAPEIVKLNLYWNFPDKVRGKLLNSQEININQMQEIKLSDYINFREYSLSEIIIEFEFNLLVNEKEISAYLRLNNECLRKSFGDLELDIYPFENISNFGDLLQKNNLEDIKKNIESVIVKYPKELGFIVKEAYIAVSYGEPSLDLSKRIWIYYSQPFLLIADLLNFIKNFKELEFDEGFNVPNYLVPVYEGIIHKIRPYSVDFLSREFMGSEKFSKRFNYEVMQKTIEIRKGSLILSSNNIENNFLLARDLSEKMIFPVMQKVTGDTEFRDILDKSL